VVGVSSGHLTPITVVLSIMVAGIWLQLSTYPNHDVAWVLWGAREILHGAKFGRDIIEPNPPLAWYLSLPTTALAEWIHVPLDWTFRVAVAIAGACSAASLAWLAARERSELGVACLCGIAGLALLILPGREFGQREHLLMIAILPYLALCAGWLSGREPASARVRLGLGIIAGLGVALKPYFLAAPALTELGLLLLGSRRPAIFRAENLGIATVCLVYLLWIATFERAYALEAAPLAGSIYWSFNLPLSAILPALLTQAAVAAPFAGIALLKRDALGAITGFAWLGLAASYLVQQKGYGYHLLPVIIANLLLIASVLTNGTLDGKVRVAASTVAVVFAFTCAAPLRNWWVINKPGGQRSHEIDRILASIDREARNGRFLAVSVHPYPSFPAAIYTSARYTSRTNSEWFLPAVAQIRLNGATGHDTAAIERHAREFILHDLGARPNLVLIDTNSARHTVSSRRFDILAFYEEDPRFRSLWSSYREIERIGDYRQFVLVEGQLPPVRAIG
jgi:hypothetical protein